MFLQDRRERVKDEATLPRSRRSATLASHGDGITVFYYTHVNCKKHEIRGEFQFLPFYLYLSLTFFHYKYVCIYIYIYIYMHIICLYTLLSMHMYSELYICMYFISFILFLPLPLSVCLIWIWIEEQHTTTTIVIYHILFSRHRCIFHKHWQYNLDVWLCTYILYTYIYILDI